MNQSRLAKVLIMVFLSFGAFSCDHPTYGASDLPKPKADLPTTQPSPQKAVFAGGCFWCTEAVFQQLKGVSDVTSGYAGDSKQTANYERVSAGDTNHAEAIQITYDPSQISYGELLRVFFATHDPTTKDRQGPDTGRQYRSAVFYLSDEQKKVAEAYIAQLQEAKAFDKKIVTTLEPLTEFYPAEKYHQDFMTLNPTHPYIQHWAVPKVEKVQKSFPEQAKSSSTTQP
jgi:peptide-methionine (S)-S-oxide reductase